MHGWPQYSSAALIARAKAVMAELCLKIKRLFAFSKPSQVEVELLPIEYKSALVPVEASACDHAHDKRKRGKKEPCPHCGRPFGKQPEAMTEQYLREKKEKRRLAREAAKKRKEEMGVSPAEDKDKKIA